MLKAEGKGEEVKGRNAFLVELISPLLNMVIQTSLLYSGACIRSPKLT
jgi:hypothetical protein